MRESFLSMRGSVSMAATLFVHRDCSGVCETRATVGIEVPAISEAPGPKTLRVDVDLDDSLPLTDAVSATFFSRILPDLVSCGQLMSVDEHPFEQFIIRFAIPSHANDLNSHQDSDDVMSKPPILRRMRESATPMMRLPFGDELRARIQGGYDDALLRAFVSLAAYWLEVSGASIHARHGIGATACMAQKDLHAGALTAAGLDLLHTLELSPQGRKAIADFCGQPFLQQPKGE